MKQMKKTEILSIGLMMFSVFFGAGNLIFPPSLGQSAGTNFVTAIIGFLLTGVGLPLLGIVAIATTGGDYPSFISRRVHPRFAALLLGLLYLAIGPLFAIPRTGAVSFEIGIRPFLAWDEVMAGQAIYTAIFFALTYWLSLSPGKIVDRVGKILTPALLAFLVILFVKSFVTPLGPILEPQGIYRSIPFAQGFQNGYLTMDLLASLAVGAIVVSAVRTAGVEETRQIGRICLMGGVIAIFLMSLVYVSLSYLGATSAMRLGLSANGGVILSTAAGILFGQFGQIILALIIALACLTTSVGMLSAFSSYFHEATGRRVAYRRFVQVGALFGFAASNVGLTELIRISVPFLVAIYPIVIVLVVLTLFDRLIGGNRSVYRMSLALTAVFSVITGLKTAGFDLSAIDALLTSCVPFYDVNLGWIAPAVIGGIVGGVMDMIASRAAEAGEEPACEEIATK